MSATEQDIKAKAAGETIIIYDCTCGRIHQCTGVIHYGRYYLKCGRMVWALQPKRNGPLVLRTWPGPPLTAKELAAKEAAEREQLVRDIRFTA